MNEDLLTIVKGFLDYLKKENKLQFLPEVIQLLEKKADEEELKGEVISFSPLSPKEIGDLEIVLKQKLGKRVKMTNIIDKSILGGLIVKYKDLEIDQSVKGKLKEIQEEIYGH